MHSYTATIGGIYGECAQCQTKENDKDTGKRHRCKHCFHPHGNLLDQRRTQANHTHHDALSGLIEDEVLTGKAGGSQLRQAIPRRLKVGGAVKPNSSSVRVFPEEVKWGDLHGPSSTALGADRQPFL
jgi:hypothetical protein